VAADGGVGAADVPVFRVYPESRRRGKRNYLGRPKGQRRRRVCAFWFEIWRGEWRLAYLALKNSHLYQKRKRKVIGGYTVAEMRTRYY
jgi:hypothetical protein